MPCIVVLQSFYFACLQARPLQEPQALLPSSKCWFSLATLLQIAGKAPGSPTPPTSGPLLLPITMPAPRNTILPRTLAPLPSVGWKHRPQLQTGLSLGSWRVGNRCWVGSHACELLYRSHVSNMQSSVPLSVALNAFANGPEQPHGHSSVGLDSKNENVGGGGRIWLINVHFSPSCLLVCIKLCVCIVVNKSRWENAFQIQT